jgi:hypothetical protein
MRCGRLTFASTFVPRAPRHLGPSVPAPQAHQVDAQGRNRPRQSQEDKAGLVRLLGQLHAGGSWHANHENVNFLAERTKTPEWQNQKAIELEWIGRIHAAVRAGLDEYLALLKDADAPIRLATCELLAWFKGAGDRLRKALDESLASDPDAKVRANALSALVILGLLKPDALLSFVGTDTPEPLQLTAVLWLHLTDTGHEPPTSASEQLVRMLDHPETITSQLQAVSLMGDPWAAIARGLSRCSGPLREQALLRLCANADATPWIPDERAFGILALAFPKPFSPETMLSESQRMAIACIARKAWGGIGEYVNMSDALRAYQLPTREHELETLLQMERGAFRPKAKPWVAGDEGIQSSKPWWKFW